MDHVDVSLVKQVMMIFLVKFQRSLFLLSILALQMLPAAIAQENEVVDTIPVRISYTSKAQEARLKQIVLEKYKAAIEEEKQNHYFETRLTWEQIIYLRLKNYDVALVFTLASNEISPAYHTYSELVHELDSLAERYPRLIRLKQIGSSTSRKVPIWAAKLSDNPIYEEDEPAVLITGVHHAREPLGAEICLYLIKYFCGHYEHDAQIKQWLDATEIWLVPVLNPDGLDLALNPDRRLGWWRKNCRDNNRNGRFDSDSDGVDLNRNYDFNWSDGISDVTSLYFKGAEPFSEQETRAIRDLAFQQNFIVILDYHSFGEAILYPWGNFYKAPEQNLIQDIARKFAACISKLGGQSAYDVIPLDARMGQSSVWYYAELNALAYIIETADEYYPPTERIQPICKQNLKGIRYILERLHTSRLCGHIRDAETGMPLVAQVKISDLNRVYTKPRQSDARWGRYDKILYPGTYSITFSALGYKSKKIPKIVIHEDKPTVLDVELFEERPERPLGNY
ncbi:hypothetical protein JXJ21_15815 [candidate division KSB1 bacterium]|nr:hypothetical protein [candidate division KSB1 bacterium]